LKGGEKSLSSGIFESTLRDFCLSVMFDVRPLIFAPIAFYMQPTFPTEIHKKAAESVNAYFENIDLVDTILVVNSCARGQAVADSDLDFAILMAPGSSIAEIHQLEIRWRSFALTSPALLGYRDSGPHAHLHLDLITGDYEPGQMEAGGMPDFFELEIGNQVCYSAPMGKAGPFFGELQGRWLPYYDEGLRMHRFQMAAASCAYDLDRIRSYVERGLFFYAFERLTVAFQKFLQALFISKGVYPIAYDKWIRLQVETWLRMPELYLELPRVLSVGAIESCETAEKAEMLRMLLRSL
jgi:predicted nucleotidyltransferase